MSQWPPLKITHWLKPVTGVLMDDSEIRKEKLKACIEELKSLLAQGCEPEYLPELFSERIKEYQSMIDGTYQA